METLNNFLLGIAYVELAILFFAALFYFTPIIRTSHPLKEYSLQTLLAIDQWFNVRLGGDANETLSSRAGKRRTSGSKGWKILADFLDWLDSDHCENARKKYED